MMSVETKPNYLRDSPSEATSGPLVLGVLLRRLPKRTAPLLESSSRSLSEPPSELPRPGCSTGVRQQESFLGTAPRGVLLRRSTESSSRGFPIGIVRLEARRVPSHQVVFGEVLFGSICDLSLGLSLGPAPRGALQQEPFSFARESLRGVLFRGFSGPLRGVSLRGCSWWVLQ
jgi:hypothetical protein